MTLQEFINKYNGKKIDYDSWYGAQCMDLMHQYIDEVLLNKHSPETLRAPSAKLAYQNFSADSLFEKIENTPTGIPKEGDLIFWGGGEFGHVAIFIEGTVSDFTSFDQNFPLDSACHKQYHDYTNVIGWIRYKVTNDSCEEIRLDRDYQEREKEKYKEEARAGRQTIENLTKEIQEKNEQITELQDKITSQKVTIDELTSTNAQLNDKVVELLGTEERLGNEIETLESELNTALDKQKELEMELEKCRENGPLCSFSWTERFTSLFICRR